MKKEERNNNIHKSRNIHDSLVRILGVWFIILSIIGAYILSKENVAIYLLWFCNHAGFILGLAMLFRSRFWLLAEISLGLLPQLFWSIDFIGYRFFNTYIFNVANYMFEAAYPKNMYLISLNHLFMMPIALYALWALGLPKKKAYYGAFIHGGLLFIISYFFTNLTYNLNCAFKSCLPWIPQFKLYPTVWIIVFIGMVYVTYWGVQKVYKKFGVKEYPY